MSSLRPQDRKSFCRFTFADGRQCRTPRSPNHPHFCSDHARKESQARAAEKLAEDLAYFFSGDYLSACNLSTALGRLIPAVVRGHVKPKTARTVAYLAQTLLQAIHISQHEYINAFGTDEWRNSVRTSVNSNYDYLFPPAPQPERSVSLQPQPQPTPTPPQPVAPACPVCHPERSEGSHPIPATRLQTGRAQAPQPAPAPQPSPQPAPSPHTPLPPTSTEFVQRVVAGLQTGEKSPLP